MDGSGGAGKISNSTHILHITYSSKKEWLQQLAFFAVFYVLLFGALHYFKKNFYPNAIPWADALASASAYTGMWLMAKKKAGKLDLVDHHQYRFHPFIFCKRVCVYQRLLPGTAGFGYWGAGRMAKKDTKKQGRDV